MDLANWVVIMTDLEMTCGGQAAALTSDFFSEAKPSFAVAGWRR